MYIPRSALLAALALTFALVGPAAAAEDPAHAGHGGEAPHRLQLDDGKQWATDAPLRQGMGALNQAMAAALPRIHKNRFTAAETMHGKTGQPRHAGALRVLQALQDYGEYFDHPGWKPVRG